MVWAKGQQLQCGKYVIEEVLGQGGFGITYKVLHVPLNHLVVIKTPNAYLKYDRNYEKYVKQFIKEGQRLARLSKDPHPHIVKVHSSFKEGETHCLVMDFVDGKNLFELMMSRQERALPEAEAVKWVQQIGEALVKVHQTGLAHRDAHPGNIIVQSNSDAVLIDFGIAKELIPSTQTTTGNAGNQGFAPYEQMTAGSREPTVDVYCLAATLYYLVTGKPPSTALDRKLNNASLIPPNEIITDISNRLNLAILNGMELEAKDRPGSMQEWLRLLEEPTDNSTNKPPDKSISKPPDKSISKPPDKSISKPPDKSIRNSLWIGAIGSGIVLVLLVLIYLFFLSRKEPTPSVSPSVSPSASPSVSPSASPKPSLSPKPSPSLNSTAPSTVKAKTKSSQFSSLPRLEGKATVVLKVKGSPITIEVDGTNAPITAGNFVDLVQRGVYKGLAFHRVVREPQPFVVQGGDPQGKDRSFPLTRMGTGAFIDPETSQERRIPLEIKPKGAESPIYSKTFKQAGVSNSPVLRNTRGAVAMGRTLKPDSASSQFYIALAELPFLDGDYAVFGYVIEGMDVVGKIQQGDRIESAKVTQGIENLKK